MAISLSQSLRSSERPNRLCHSLSAAPEDFLRPLGTAFYDLKTPQEKVQRAIRQGLEGLCMEAVASVERVHPTTVQRWVDRACLQAKAAGWDRSYLL